MTQKFGRNYRLTIYPPDGGPPILITRPLTVVFNILRDTGSELNRLDIDIYNLSEATRKRIFQDRYVLGNYVDQEGNQLLDSEGNPIGSHNIVLEAGYDNLYRVFYGRIFQASSAREGTNIITRIEARDGNSDVSASQTFQTIDAGRTIGDILKYLIGNMPTLELGAVGDYNTVMRRPVILNGNTWNLLQQYSNRQVFIDNGKIYALQNNEALNQTTLINDASGLLDTPRREEGYLLVQCLLETGISVGQQVAFQSSVMEEYNGTYKVIGVVHQAVISSAVSGRARTMLRLLAPNQFNGANQEQGFKVVEQS